MKVLCKCCKKSVIIKPLAFQKHVYKNDVTCFKCWSSSKTISKSSNVIIPVNNPLVRSSSSKFIAGDFVYINTGKFLIYTKIVSTVKFLNDIEFKVMIHGKQYSLKEKDLFSSREYAFAANPMTLS